MKGAKGSISEVQFEDMRNLNGREAVDKQKQGMIKEIPL